MPIKGSCHCGATQFEIDFVPDKATRCNCTFCTKYGVFWGYCTPDKFRLLTPSENVATYTHSNPDNKHHFCATCGCSTFGEAPDYSTGEPNYDKPMISLSLNALEDFDVWALPVEELDGRNLW